MTTFTSRLGSVPQEVLEHIAFCAATRDLVGPPSGLHPLLLTCQNVYRTLSLEANPYLYARMFSSKFDTRSVFRRLGPHVNPPRVLAIELKKRWIYLKRIKARTDSRIRHPEVAAADQSDLLWFAYLMMLENDGKNEQQLLDYAEMDVWLMEYWFDGDGASLAAHMIFQRVWPVEDKNNSIAMWLFWFLLRSGTSYLQGLCARTTRFTDFVMRNITRLRHMMTVMKVTALAANHVCVRIECSDSFAYSSEYPVCDPSWTEFLPRSETLKLPSLVTHFSETYQLNPPVLAPPAILAFLTLTLQILRPAQPNDATEYTFQAPASLPLTKRRSEDWDSDWYRCVHLGQSDRCRAVSETYALGSLDGVWEGLFAVSTRHLLS